MLIGTRVCVCGAELLLARARGCDLASRSEKVVKVLYGASTVVRRWTMELTLRLFAAMVVTLVSLCDAFPAHGGSSGRCPRNILRGFLSVR